MTPTDKQTIQSWAHRLPAGSTIALVAAQGDKAEAISRFGEQLKKLLPELKITIESDAPVFDSPALVLGQHKNIAFQAVPGGKILEAFFDALTDQSSATDPQDDQITALLHRIDLPTSYKLYIAPQCPHCPGVLGQLIPLVSQNRFIRLTIIDAQLFSQESRNDQIKSVPTLMLDDHFRWSGQINLNELLTMSFQRDPAQLSAASLRQLIEDGQAERVAVMMIDSDRVFPALIDLLVHDRWSVRLGAMVTAEYLAEQSQSLSRQLCDMVWARFPDLQDQAQGDVVHLLGEINTKQNQTRLQQVVSGNFSPAAKEAASEVLSDLIK